MFIVAFRLHFSWSWKWASWHMYNSGKYFACHSVETCCLLSKGPFLVVSYVKLLVGGSAQNVIPVSSWTGEFIWQWYDSVDQETTITDATSTSSSIHQDTLNTQVQQMWIQPCKRQLPSPIENATTTVVAITSQPYAESPENGAPEMNTESPGRAEDSHQPILATIPLPGPAAKEQVPTAGEVHPHAGAEKTIAGPIEANWETANIWHAHRSPSQTEKEALPLNTKHTTTKIA